MATFPSYAKILLPGFSEEPDYGVLRTDMDGGLAKQRPRWNKPVVTREATILVYNLADKLAFDEWAGQELTGAAGWFDWLDPLDGVTKKTRIVGGKYRWTSPGVVWLAQCQLETIG
ncbi:hypothetical protein ERD78_18880 [Allopusillimonas soli]|uniref:Uncharacterized protein n=1 Tax=Allopusillimonas soli TaxID=659016 RepID=A0A853FG59_9BURK|nr:hypothetical protein [Allopusillimonas soli]NYT38867.1 hypothetical protein [Allopusillimonas soli]TEA70134.1 hypothetical protein ERD78_18880 [Allopusillimonas soli]